MRLPTTLFASRLGALLLGIFALAPTLALAQTPTAVAHRSDEPVWRYTVRPGDTLIGLGRRYLRDPAQWPQIQRDNRIGNTRRIPPGTVLSFPANLLRQQPSMARLVQAFGAVRWRAQASDPWQDARLGQMLAAGAQVQASDSGNAVIELANGTRLALLPGSMLTLDTLSLYADGLMADTRLRLQQGQIDIHDNPRHLPNQHLRILTPSAQAVVRGTQFRVAVGVPPPDLPHGVGEVRTLPPHERGWRRKRQSQLLGFAPPQRGWPASQPLDGLGWGWVTREETLGGAVDLQAAGAQVRVDAGMGSLAREGQPPLPPVRLLPAPDVSALPSRFEQLPLRFELAPQTGAASWFGQVSPQNAPAQVLVQKTAPGPSFSVADLPNGRYVLRLRAVDAHGLQGRDALHAFTVFARPFFPLLIAPVKGATVRTARPALTWSQVLDVARTHVQVAAQDDFAQPLYDIVQRGAQWIAPADLPAGIWHWRAASIDAQGRQGPWSPPQAFRYVPGPGPANLSKATLRFDRDHLLLDLPAAPPGQHYALTLSDHASLQPALAQAQTPGGALTLPRPSSGKRYLGARLVDDSDGTQGPPVVQVVDVPPRYPYLWLLLIPLLPAL